MQRLLTESNEAPTTVELRRPRPANAAACEKHFACPVRFGCERDVPASDLTWLDCALPMANAMAYRQSRQLLERESDRARTPSAQGMVVERAIRRADPLAVAPAELASSLHLSERSLRRKLAQAGLSVRGLLDQARKARAMELMADARASLTHIAMQTGFSDVRAYSRAFKRWAGKSPSAFHTAVQALEGDADDGGH